MFSRVRAALSGFWPRRRVPQVEPEHEPEPVHESVHAPEEPEPAHTSAPHSISEEELARTRKELSERFISELNGPPILRRSRVSLYTTWRNHRIVTARRFETASRNIKNIKREASSEATSAGGPPPDYSRSLVNLFKPQPADSPKCKEKRKHFLEEYPFPLDSSDDEEDDGLPEEKELEQSRRERAAAFTPVSHSPPAAADQRALYASPLTGTSPVHAEPSFSRSVAPKSAAASTPSSSSSSQIASSPTRAAATANPSLTAAVTPAAAPVPLPSISSATAPVATEATDRATYITSPNAGVSSVTVTPASRATTAPFTPSHLKTEAPVPSSSVAAAASDKPRYRWPKRKRSSFEPRETPGLAVPPAKRQKIPPHRGWLLSPVGEEPESAIQTERVAQFAPLDFESEPENFTPFRNQEHGSFEDYLTGGNGRSFSEPPEEGDYLSDPMDIDGDFFNAEVAWLNSQKDNLQPDTTRQLPGPSVSRKRRSKGQSGDVTYNPGRSDAGSNLSDDDSDFDIPDISNNEGRGLSFDFSREKVRRLSNLLNRQTESMGAAERELFLHCGMRGFEPIIPEHWQFDFRTLPECLFLSPEDEGRPLLYASGSPDFHGIRALTNLFSVSGRVRDCRVLDTRPETQIRRGLRNFLRWAIRDSKVRRTSGATPIYSILCKKRGESTLDAVKRLNRRLRSLANGYRGTDHRPLLIGFAIAGPICLVVTYDTNPDNRTEGHSGPKFLCQLDMSDQSQDVWNSLTLAIVVNHIRETMAQLATDGAQGYEFTTGKEEKVEEDEDL